MAQVILVTGSNSGFGRAIAEMTAREQYTVFASMRDVAGKNAPAAHDLRSWAERERLDLRVLELDVTDEAAAEKAVAEILDAAGRLDVVVNNAGISFVGLTEAFTIAQAQHLFDVNVFGALRVNKAVLPAMRRQGSGLLIQISSTFGRLPMPFSGLYSASKFAVEGLAEAYAYELAPLGIDSVIVEPGPFPTELGTKIVFPLDEQVTREYGEAALRGQKLGETLGRLFSSPDAPQPQQVADAVKILIELPQGQRPLRTVVDPMTSELIETVNQTSSRTQPAFLRAFGLM